MFSIKTISHNICFLCNYNMNKELHDKLWLFNSRQSGDSACLDPCFSLPQECFVHYQAQRSKINLAISWAVSAINFSSQNPSFYSCEILACYLYCEGTNFKDNFLVEKRGDCLFTCHHAKSTLAIQTVTVLNGFIYRIPSLSFPW